MMKLYIFLIFLVFILLSCNNKIVKNNKKIIKKTINQENIEMEAVIVKKDKIISISELFKEANDFVISSNYERALVSYEKLRKIISKEDMPLLNYNIAVTYYKMNKFKNALAIYLKLLENKKIDNQFLIDIIINITEIYGKSKNWYKINSLLDNYYKRFNFIENKWDYLELSIRYEVALYHENRYDAAEFTSLKAYQYFKRYRKIFSYLSREQRYFLSMGYFFIGEITRQRFRDIKIQGNMKKMIQVLDKKSELVLRAQNYYMNSMNFKDKYWATASGYRIGEMYDVFYDQLINAKINIKLTFEEKVVYKEELKLRIQNLLKKAIAIFQENIAMSERLSENNLWIKKTLRRLENAKTKYLQIKRIEINKEL